MWKNYLKTAYRNIIRNKVYAGMNVLGLTIGITCFSIIGLFIENELSFDKYQKNESFRFLLTEQTGDGNERTYGIVRATLLDEIADNIAGIEDVILLRNWGAGPVLFEHKDVGVKTRSIISAEADFFEYVDVDFLRGDKSTALDEPNNVVISASFAKTLFGDENPIGETFQVSGNMTFDLVITGVYKDIKNSHMDFDVILNFDLKDKKEGYIILREGFANSVYGYFKFEKGTNPEDISVRLKAYFQEKLKDDQEELASLEREAYTFQSIYDIYFGSNNLTFDEGFKHGNKDTIWLLGTIGLFILLIACMNYINAATAKSMSRAKEIGVRKVFGAFKFQLIYQFLGEALLITFVSVLFSVLLTDLAMPAFENLMQTEFRFSLLTNPSYRLGLVLILITVTLLSGIYPAFVLSKFKPSDSLKANAGQGVFRGNGLRSLLVGIQLFFTMALISGVLLIIKQSNYIQDKDLGFSQEDILIVPNGSPKISNQLKTFENELLNSPLVKQVTVGMDVLGFETTNNSGRVILEGTNPNEAPVATFFTVGMDFIDLHDIEFVDGRNFNAELSTDSGAIIVNEAYLKAVGEQNIVGKKVHLWQESTPARPIIGVVKDFNFMSLKSAVSPSIFQVSRGYNWFFSIKIDSKNKQEALASVRAAWQAIEPNYPFEYMFLEDQLKDYYGDENRLYKAIQTFSIICILIACLGLYGMTSFTIERRIKELGVRKVLGARSSQLVWLINSRFVTIVIVAALMAVPVVYYLINQWLDTFAYHTEVGWFSFVVSLLIVLAIVMTTVSSLAVQASFTNPAKTLRSE